MGVQGISGLLNWATICTYSAVFTRYLDKVREKFEQHEVLCKLLAHEGYEVISLPIVLVSAGTLFQCLKKASKDLNIPSTQSVKIFSTPPPAPPTPQHPHSAQGGPPQALT